jgi:hypothetical protein
MNRPKGSPRGEPPTRTEVRTVACPACGALAGQACRLHRPKRDGSDRRAANHRERIDLYRRLHR